MIKEEKSEIQAESQKTLVPLITIYGRHLGVRKDRPSQNLRHALDRSENDETQYSLTV